MYAFKDVSGVRKMFNSNYIILKQVFSFAYLVNCSYLALLPRPETYGVCL